MRITTEKIKKIIITLGLIFPIFLIQLSVSSNYAHMLTESLVEKHQATIELYDKALNKQLIYYSTLVNALNALPQIDDSLELAPYIQILNSKAPDNTLEDSQRIINLIKVGPVALDQSGNTFYFQNLSKQNNRILVLKIPTENLIESLFPENQEKLALCLFTNSRVIYETDDFVHFSLSNNMTTEVTTFDGRVLLTGKFILEALPINVIFMDDLTDEMHDINQKLRTYNTFVSLGLLALSILYLKFGRIGHGGLSKLEHQLSFLESALLQKQNIEHHKMLPELPIQFELEHYAEHGLRLVKNIDAFEKQIEHFKAESVLLDAELSSHDISLSKLEELHDLTLEMRDAFADFVDQVLIVIDDKLNVINVNHAYLQKMGYKRADVVGKRFTNFILEDDDVTTTQLLNARKEPVFINLKHKNLSDSTAEFISLKSVPWDRHQVLLIGKSIHDEISLQSRILRKNRELEYINQINSSLISNWGFNELLENIIRRIDYLFSIEIGTIYVKNNVNQWELKATATTLAHEEDAYLSDFEHVLDTESADLKLLDVNALNNQDNPLSQSVNHLIVAPLEADGSIIAVMVIGLNTKMKNTDLNVLRMFKNQASMVIQRAILYEQLRIQYSNTIEALVNVIEAKDKYTEGHSRRVSRFSVEIAHEMGYSNEDIENIEISGLLHDVGKVGINQKILNKIGKLTPEEYEIVKEHPEKGIQILQSIKLDSKIVEGIRYHHVRYDLKGYPENHGLEHLPAYAAIIGVADAFDAMSSARSYSKPRSVDEAAEELRRCTGTQFDPEVVTALILVIEHDRNRIQTIIDDLRS